MQVRRAGPDDVPAAARLHAEVQALHRAAHPERYKEPTPDELEGWIRKLLADPVTVLLLAEDGGQAVGFAAVRREASRGNALTEPRLRAVVDGLGVAATARRRGAGRALMAAAEELARGWGAAAVVLDVQGFNAEAERFYRALGYEVASTRLTRPV